MTMAPRTPVAGALGAAVALSTELTAYYTSVGQASVIDQCTLTNLSNQQVRVMAIHLVPQGQEASAATMVMTRISLEPFDTYTCAGLVGHVLDEGASVQAYAEVPGVVVLRMSGRTGV